MVAGGPNLGYAPSANLALSYWQLQTVCPVTGSVMMGLPFSQHPDPVPPTGVVAPPVPGGPTPVVVVAVDEGESAPGLSAPPDDIAGDVAVVGCPPLTRS